MSQTFQCPTCGAPLDVPNTGETTLRCPFCSNSVIIPETLRGSPAGSTAPNFTGVNAGEHLQELAEIGRLIRAGNKLEAIRIYRQTFGGGLKEANDAVEALERGEPVRITQTVTRFSTQFPQTAFQATPPVVSTERSAGARVLIFGMAVLIIFVTLGLGLYFLMAPAVPETSGGPAPVLREITQAVATVKAQEASITPKQPTYGDAALLLSFGEKGMGAGQFEDARSITVDPQGNIYLGEYQSGRILMFDAAGKYLAQWNTGEKKAALLGLAVDRTGTLFVAQSGDLFRFKAQTGELITRTKYGGVGSYLNYAAVNPDGGLLLVSSGEDIWRFNAQGKQTLSIPKAVSKISDNSELVTHGAVDGQGNMYLLGTFNNAVFKYSTDGKYQNQFGSAGNKPGLFQAPEQIAVDGLGRVYVSDIKGVQIFDTSGRYLGLIKVQGAAFGMAVDDQNNLFVITNLPKVYKFKVNVTP